MLDYWFTDRRKPHKQSVILFSFKKIFAIWKCYNRKLFFTNQFENIFEEDIKLHPVTNGLHFIAKLPNHLDDVKVSEFLGKNEIVRNLNYFS